MGSGDLSTDLNLGMLAPATSIHPDEGQSSHQDSEHRARRQTRAEEAEKDQMPEAVPSEATEDPEHQIDHLA